MDTRFPHIRTQAEIDAPKPNWRDFLPVSRRQYLAMKAAWRTEVRRGDALKDQLFDAEAEIVKLKALLDELSELDRSNWTERMDK